MVYKFTIQKISDKKLTSAVLQVIDMLAMYQAELARILHLQCYDIGQLASGKVLLQKESLAWKRALLFVQFFNKLYDFCSGDGVAMCHWLRKPNKILKGTPFFMIVDDDKLFQVLIFLNDKLARKL